MRAFCFIPLLVAAILGEESEEGSFRFFGLTAKTITYYQISSATTTVTSTPFCYTIAPLVSMPTTSTTLTTSLAAARNCRRKRWAYESPVDGELGGILAGNPVAASVIEVSALPEMRSFDSDLPSGSFENLRFVRSAESDAQGQLYTAIDSSIADEMDLPRVYRSANQGSERFVQLITTAKTTLTMYATITNNAATKTLTLGCTPQGASLSSC